MATAASYFSGKKYGGIPSIPPGTTFPDRKALRASGVHAEVRAGIFAEKYRDGAYAVLLYVFHHISSVPMCGSLSMNACLAASAHFEDPLN